MSKFDAVLKRIEEALPPVTPQQNVQPQALQQAAKLLNLDPKVLEQILAAQKQAQTSTQTQTPSA